MHAAAVWALAYSPDGRTLYSGDMEGSLHAWDARSGAHLRALVGHERAVLDVAFSPDGGSVVSASTDGSVRWWSALSGALERTHRDHTCGVFAVAHSGADLVTASYDCTLRASPSRLVMHGHEAAVTGVIRIGPVLISGSRDCTLRCWDPGSGRELRRCRAHDRWVTKLRAAGDRGCVTASEDGTVALWDVSLGRRWVQRVEPDRPPVWGLDVSADGRLAVSGDASGVAKLWNVEDGRLIRTFARADLGQRACALSPDGAHVALGCDDGGLEAYAVATGERLWTSRGKSLGILSAVARSKEGPVATGRANGRIEVRAADGSVWRTLDGHGRFVYVLRAVDHDRFVSGAFDGDVSVWNWNTGERLLRVRHGALVFSVAVCTDAHRIVTAGGAYARVWDLDNGERLAELPIDSAGVHNFACATSDAGTIVTGNETGLLDVWQRRESRYHKVRSIDTALETDLLCALTMTRDGATVILGTAGGAVVVVDLTSGTVRARYPCHEDWIRELRVSRDGALLALCQNTSFAVLDLDSGAAITPSLSLEHAAAVAQLDDGTLAAVDLAGRVHWSI